MKRSTLSLASLAACLCWLPVSGMAQSTPSSPSAPAPEAEPTAEPPADSRGADSDESADDEAPAAADPESPPAAPADDEEAEDTDAEESPPEDSDPGLGDDEDTGSILNDLLEDMEQSDEAWGDSGEQGPTYPYIEHSGYFRFRADMFFRGHLGVVGRQQDGGTVKTTGFLPPLSRNEPNTSDQSQLDSDAKDEDTVAGANIRLRYSPTIHIQDWLRVRSTFDILDNLVLGSTPDFAPFRPDAPMAFFAGSQAPPSDGRNSVADSVRVKEVFGEVQSPFGTLRFGRMANHFGLGILANGGTHLDSDFGDFVDRVSVTSTLWGIHFQAAWDFMGEGLLATDQNQYFGQPYDATQVDDVIQVVFSVFQTPLTDEQVDARRNRLNDSRLPAFDWGAYFVFRQQEYDAAAANQPSYAPSVIGANGDVVPNVVSRGTFDDFTLVRRGAWTVIPDLWARMEWLPSYRERLRIEVEAVFLYGEIDSAVDNPDPSGPKPDMTMLQWGGVMQAEYQRGGLLVGLEVGAASGDDAPGLGVLDQTNFATGNQQVASAQNRRLTNFVFDRNYYVDLIMFREVIGAVTNAAYVKPTVQYDLFGGISDSLGGRLDIISAWALEPNATPGRSSWYGIEFDAQIFYEEKDRFRADLSWGTFVPGDAFDLPAGFQGAVDAVGAADFAMTVQGRFFLMF